MLTRTAAYEQALADVARHQVVYHPAYEPRGDRYGWRPDGDMPPAEDEALRQLEHCHLVVLIPACIEGRIGCEVDLTPAGQDLLRQWAPKCPRCGAPYGCCQHTAPLSDLRSEGDQ